MAWHAAVIIVLPYIQAKLGRFAHAVTATASQENIFSTRKQENILNQENPLLEWMLMNMHTKYDIKWLTV